MTKNEGEFLRKMRDSGIEWIGEIPADWEVSTIKREYSFQTGWTPDTTHEEYFTGENIWINISDMKSKVIYNSEKHISDGAVQLASMNISPKGSLLYAFKLSVGAVAFCGNDMYTNEAIATFLPGKNSLRFLYYTAPIFIIKNANENIYGAKLLNQKLIRNAKIIVPPLAVQERIADYLDHKCSQIDAIIARQQEVIEKLKAYRLSVITEAVTKGLNPDVPMKDSGVEWIGEVPGNWTKVKLKNTCQFINGDRSSNYPSPNEHVDDGIPFLGADSLCGRYVDITQSKKITKAKYHSMGGAKIRKGDILYTLRGSTIGKNAMATFDEGTVASSLMVIRPISLIPEYLLYWLNSEEEFQQRQSYINGSTAPNLSAENVGSFVMFLPSAVEQREIADYLDKKCAEIELTMLKKQMLADQLSNYKKSLIYEVVTGKKEV